MNKGKLDGFGTLSNVNVNSLKNVFTLKLSK